MNQLKYRYREVKCPWCDHIFMWTGDDKEGLILHKYVLKETNEFIEKAKCPKCEEEMIILPHIFEGVDIEDKRIELRSAEC